MKRKKSKWWRTPPPSCVSIEVHRDITELLKAEQLRYRRVALFLAELASMESRFYKDMKAEEIIFLVDGMFTETLGRRYDERHRHH